MQTRERKLGFSFLELIAVITILGLLVLLVVPRFYGAIDRARENSCYKNVSEINSAAERYFLTNNQWPSSIDDLKVDDYFPGGIPNCPLTDNLYALDNNSHRVIGHSQTGGKTNDH